MSRRREPVRAPDQLRGPLDDDKYAAALWRRICRPSYDYGKREPRPGEGAPWLIVDGTRPAARACRDVVARMRAGETSFHTLKPGGLEILRAALKEAEQ